jgi:hypothetical protein
LTDGKSDQIERHPERRFAAAYKVYETKRLAEMAEDGEGKGLRRQQRIDIIRKEFERHDDNPFNQVHVKHNARKSEVKEMEESVKEKLEDRLAAEK